MINTQLKEILKALAMIYTEILHEVYLSIYNFNNLITLNADFK